MQRRTEATESWALHRSGSMRNSMLTQLLRHIAGRLPGSVMLGVLLAAVIASPAYSQNLQGIVKGRDGQPKSYVLVDILGPSNVHTQTDAAGRFEATVRAGAYVIRIREGRRRMEFSRRVTGEVHEEEFKLRW
jgi:hypothetical protein